MEAHYRKMRATSVNGTATTKQVDPGAILTGSGAASGAVLEQDEAIAGSPYRPLWVLPAGPRVSVMAY